MTDSVEHDALMLEGLKMWTLAAATMERDVLLHELIEDEKRVMISAVLNASDRLAMRKLDPALAIPNDEGMREAWQPRIGEEVTVCSEQHASDWVDAAGHPLVLHVAAISAMHGGGYDVTITDEWPIPPAHWSRGQGHLTDGFIVGRSGDADDLRPCKALAATPSPVEDDEMIERVARAMAGVIAKRHGDETDYWLSDERREEARAAIAATKGDA